jgi:hypothetical protein
MQLKVLVTMLLTSIVSGTLLTAQSSGSSSSAVQEQVNSQPGSASLTRGPDPGQLHEGIALSADSTTGVANRHQSNSAQPTFKDWEVHNLPATNVVTDPKQNPDSEVEPLLTRLFPHPYLLFGPALGGGGYRPLALRVETGLNVESRHWVMKALAAYDNDRKTDDGTQPNPKGHDRYLDGGIYFRPSWLPSQLAFLGTPDRWFFGGGYRWSQLSTTNYTKGGSRPQFGGGRDFVMRSCSLCRRDFSMRVAVDYFTAGTDWQNGSHGAEVTLTFPRPRENRHWFWREQIEIYRYHQSVTDPTNIALTREQLSNKGVDSASNFGIFYRF